MPDITERSEAEWMDELRNFRQGLYTSVFAPLGFSLAEAWMSWQLNLIRNDLIDVETQLKVLNGEDDQAP